ncbi:hypothetical protein OSB04_014474 [Centaurea solstitialis]|uniref:Uncharacterized protein n=1 Tax=Centaurea solstitialis TaxID=347529 RepID=A0AA38WHS4_9ASTR|nr:hypothetical protein OSB04_014474 [Centaurea solstitialis]
MVVVEVVEEVVVVEEEMKVPIVATGGGDVCGDEQYQLTIHQEPTSTSKEWSVTLENHTPCVILNVKLDCKGFQSRTTIDPKIILKQDDLCIVNGGERINPGQSLHFLYISEQQFPFKLADQSVAYII